MTTVRRMKLAWRYRKYLWKYRAWIRHRKEIAGIAAAGAVLLAGNCAYRYAVGHRAARSES